MFTATASAVRSTLAVSLLFIACCLTSVAQGVPAASATAKGPQIRVTGRIVEDGSGKGLKSASLYMKHLGDGSITGDLADADGRVNVANAKPGKYHIAVSLLGYAKFKDTIVIAPDKQSFELYCKRITITYFQEKW